MSDSHMGHFPKGPREAYGAKRVHSAIHWCKVTVPDLYEELGLFLVGIVLAAADQRKLNAAYVRKRAATWR